MKKDKNSPNCPISGKPGEVRRSMTGKEIFDLYETYQLYAIKKEHFCIPFDAVVKEYYSEESGLVWYHPRQLGDGAYYAHLAEVNPGYYNPESWDKVECLNLLTEQRPDWVVEVGSGDGWLLDRLTGNGINAFGIEINAESSKRCRARGLKVLNPNDHFEPLQGNGILCLLQTLEHLDCPLQVMEDYVEKFHPRYIHLSAPCYESLLGHTSDPLAWPPHHATSWSERAMHCLGDKLGYTNISTSYSPLRYAEFAWKQKKEPAGKFFLLPRFPGGKLGRIAFTASRLFKKPWNTRAHSIYSVFERQN